MPQAGRIAAASIGRWIDALGIALGLLALGAAVLRMLSSASLDERFGWITLAYLAASAALALLPRVREFAVGDLSVKLGALEERVAEARDIALAAESGVGPQASEFVETGTTGTRKVPGLIADVVSGADDQDPWKGAFGDPVANGLRLSAAVRPTQDGDWFLITLFVGPAERRGRHLDGPVRFFLHPTFPNDKPIRFPGPDGVATLTLRAWGAFTVGCLADDGRTKLELDLSADESFPTKFRER